MTSVTSDVFTSVHFLFTVISVKLLLNKNAEIAGKTVLSTWCMRGSVALSNSSLSDRKRHTLSS